MFDAVLILVLFGVLLDYLDGLAARLLNAESNFGKHLDSLSDIITSGVVPGIVVYQLFKLSGNRVTDFDLNAYLFCDFFPNKESCRDDKRDYHPEQYTQRWIAK